MFGVLQEVMFMNVCAPFCTGTFSASYGVEKGVRAFQELANRRGLLLGSRHAKASE